MWIMWKNNLAVHIMSKKNVVKHRILREFNKMRAGYYVKRIFTKKSTCFSGEKCE